MKPATWKNIVYNILLTVTISLRYQLNIHKSIEVNLILWTRIVIVSNKNKNIDS
jgi:hypothetical protein